MAGSKLRKRFDTSNPFDDPFGADDPFDVDDLGLDEPDAAAAAVEVTHEPHGSPGRLTWKEHLGVVQMSMHDRDAYPEKASGIRRGLWVSSL